MSTIYFWKYAEEIDIDTETTDLNVGGDKKKKPKQTLGQIGANLGGGKIDENYGNSGKSSNDVVGKVKQGVQDLATKTMPVVGNIMGKVKQVFK